MTHTTEERQTNTAGLVLLAALAGATAALLFAPKKGTETREEIKGRYNDMMTRTQTKVGDAQSKVAEKVSAASDKVKTMADQTASKTKTLADKANDKANTATKKTTSDTLSDETDVVIDPITGTRL